MEPRAVLLWNGSHLQANAIANEVGRLGMRVEERAGLHEALALMERAPGLLLIDPAYTVPEGCPAWHEITMPKGGISLAAAAGMRNPELRCYGRDILLDLVTEGRNEGMLPLALYGPVRRAIALSFDGLDYKTHVVRHITGSGIYRLPDDSAAFLDRVSELAGRLRAQYSAGPAASAPNGRA